MKTVPRKTIAQSVALKGTGLHSGSSVCLELSPADSGQGIIFFRKDLPGAPTLSLNDVFHDGPPMRSTLKKGDAEVHTVEHLLAALSGLGITDLVVRIDGPEMPGMDGSAEPFVKVIQGAGLTEFPNEKCNVLVVKEVTSVSEGGAQLVAMPNPDGLRLSYCLDYPGEPLAQGFRSVQVDEATFVNELASARTFCLRTEAEALLAAGFGKGAGTHNTLVLDGGEVVDNSLRFSDEPVRHKILDLLGDLYLLGRPICGHIIAHRSGHGLNRALARALVDNE